MKKQFHANSVGNCHRFADELLSNSRSMAELVDSMLGDADALHGRELAYLALLVSDRMRGGRVGDDLAAPEVFAAAVRDALGR